MPQINVYMQLMSQSTFNLLITSIKYLLHQTDLINNLITLSDNSAYIIVLYAEVCSFYSPLVSVN